MPGLNLSRAEAKDRADHLYVNSYVVTLDVTKGEETFYSKSEVSFTCNKPGYATFIDAVGRSVISATLNGVAADTSNFDGEKHLPNKPSCRQSLGDRDRSRVLQVWRRSSAFS